MTTRYDYLQLLAPRITDELIICNVAGATREWGNVNHREGNIYECWMSGITSVALGLALALPHRRVITLDGDGSILMGLPCLPVVAQQNPSNLIIIIFDNECYEACRAVPTFTAGKTDLGKIAQGAGIKNVRLVREPAEFEKAIDEAFKADGATFIQVKVQLPSPQTPQISRDGREDKYKFVRYIERTEKIQIIKPPVISSTKKD